jgi:hypothetical protein
MLARAYLANGAPALALEHIHLAIEQASSQDKPALLELEKQITKER